ncbi:hypothetical protein [Acidovorax sp. BLS4]|nr:hypothetical protein [Paracidovorax avenae]WOI46402.1 hypothetical protein R1Z03_04065 [Paracidovorax avenae]
MRRTVSGGIGAAAVAPGTEGARIAKAPEGILNSDPSVCLCGGVTVAGA